MSAQFFPGVVVTLKGLVVSPEKNGAQGKISYFRETTGWWMVVLEDSTNVNAKPENLALELQVASKRSDSTSKRCDAQAESHMSESKEDVIERIRQSRTRKWKFSEAGRQLCEILGSPGFMEKMEQLRAAEEAERRNAANQREEATLAENLPPFDSDTRLDRALTVYNMQHAKIQRSVKTAHGFPKPVAEPMNTFKKVNGQKLWNCEVCELRDMEVCWKRIGDYSDELAQGWLRKERKCCRVCIQRELRRALGRDDKKIKMKFQGLLGKRYVEWKKNGGGFTWGLLEDTDDEGGQEALQNEDTRSMLEVGAITWYEDYEPRAKCAIAARDAVGQAVREAAEAVECFAGLKDAGAEVIEITDSDHGKRLTLKIVDIGHRDKIVMMDYDEWRQIFSNRVEGDARQKCNRENVTDSSWGCALGLADEGFVRCMPGATLEKRDPSGAIAARERCWIEKLRGRGAA